MSDVGKVAGNRDTVTGNRGKGARISVSTPTDGSSNVKYGQEYSIHEAKFALTPTERRTL